MSDWTNSPAVELAPPFLSTFSRFSVGWKLRFTGGSAGGASITWATANQARYYPVSIPFPYLVNRVFWIVGSSTTGTRCFAIYDFGGNQLYTTGSVAAGSASVPQFVTPSTPIFLQPGDYYFGMNSSATTNALWGSTVAAVEQRFAGIQQQAVGAATLPNPAVFAAATVAGWNLCGVTWTESGF